MPVVIRLVACTQGPSPFEGQYLASYDADAGPHVYPTGTLTATPHKSDALRFASAVEAFALWRSTSTRTPVRPDGRPNRPLTAWTIEVVPAS